MDIHSEVHSWLWAMEGTYCLSRPMCGNQLEKKLAKQLLFVCLSELASKQSVGGDEANDRYLARCGSGGKEQLRLLLWDSRTEC